MPKGKLRLWEDTEVDFVRRMYGTMTAKEMGKELGRTEGSVRWKITDLGLYKKEDPADYRRDPVMKPMDSLSDSPGSVLADEEEFDDEPVSTRPWWKFW